MNQNNNIEDAFRNAFDGYEEEVSPRVWESVSRHLNTAGTSPSDPVSQGVSGSSSAGTIGGMAGKAALWFAGAALVAVTGIYYYSQNDQPAEVVATQPPVTATETPAQSADIQSEEIKNQSVYGNQANASSDAPKATIPQNDGKEIKGGITASKSEPVLQTENPVAVQEKATANQATNTSTSPSSSGKSAVPSGAASSGNVPSSIPPSTFDRYVPIITAAPNSGYAPLKVKMTYYGDATQSAWNTGDGGEIRTEPGFEHTYEQPGEYVVELTTTDPEGVKHTTKTTIVVKSPSAINTLPNVFTPNGDGLNDTFKVEGEKLTQLEVAIFNKAGKQVYRWNGPEGSWDGRLLSGETAPEGTYFYVIFARGADERSYQYKGTITLIR